FGFPEPQHMLRHVEIARHLADGAERCLGLAGRAAGVVVLMSVQAGKRRGLRRGRHQASILLLEPELIWALRSWDGRKTRTRRGRIGTSSPVLGLRPTRSPF